jgi:hypothetical protein
LTFNRTTPAPTTLIGIIKNLFKKKEKQRKGEWFGIFNYCCQELDCRNIINIGTQFVKMQNETLPRKQELGKCIMCNRIFEWVRYN